MNNNLRAYAVKAIAAMGLVGLVSLAMADDVKRLSEPVAITDTHEIFGSVIEDSGTTLSVTELVNNSEQYQDKEVQVATRIAKVCQKKGCFFVATEGAASARVSFKDYGFFIPTDSGGKEVILQGTFSRTVVSKEEADHFAKDLGESDEASPDDYQYSIVATAVQIPRT